MANDNVERFSFLYEYVAEPLEKGMKKATDLVDTFVSTTTTGLTTVAKWVATTTSSLVSLGSSKIIKGIGRIGTGIAEWSRETFQVENRLGGVFSIFKTIAKMGGLAMLLGPLALLIKPIMTFIQVITNTLQPAMDTIAGAMEAAFAPLAVTLQEVAVKILPHLMKVVDPIVSMMVEMATQVGDFFEGDALKDFTGMFIELVSNVKDMADIFVKDFLKPVGGMLFRVVIKLFKNLVELAAAFVSEIKPYLPKFFAVLQQIAGLIINTLGDALDDLFKVIIKELPTLIPKLAELVTEFVKLAPALLKLLPPLTALAINLLKFLTPVTVNLLVKLVDLFVKLAEYALPQVELGVNALLELFTMIGEWYDREGEGIKKFWKDTFAAGVDVAILAMERLVGWVEAFVVAMEDGLRLFGIMSGKEKDIQQREQQSQIQFESGQSPEAIRAKWEGNIDRSVEQWIKAGKSDDWIWAQRAIMAGRREAEIMTAIAKKKEGGYMVKPQVVMVGDGGPEWIVPDTEEGLAKYLPAMINSVYKGTTGRAGATAGNNTSMLKEIAAILRSIESILLDTAENDEFLPEVL